mmetsp:Transcript_12056/g.36326  ORF Transcript_12056/g.36326 Transcript_12056/m.36326 type:complete len:461 (+) Transcript_12056:340-1722(+)
MKDEAHEETMDGITVAAREEEEEEEEEEGKGLGGLGGGGGAVDGEGAADARRFGGVAALGGLEAFFLLVFFGLVELDGEGVDDEGDGEVDADEGAEAVEGDEEEAGVDAGDGDVALDEDLPVVDDEDGEEGDVGAPHVVEVEGGVAGGVEVGVLELVEVRSGVDGASEEGHAQSRGDERGAEEELEEARGRGEHFQEGLADDLEVGDGLEDAHEPGQADDEHVADQGGVGVGVGVEDDEGGDGGGDGDGGVELVALELEVALEAEGVQFHTHLREIEEREASFEDFPEQASRMFRAPRRLPEDLVAGLDGDGDGVHEDEGVDRVLESGRVDEAAEGGAARQEQQGLVLADVEVVELDQGADAHEARVVDLLQRVRPRGRRRVFLQGAQEELGALVVDVADVAVLVQFGEDRAQGDRVHARRAVARALDEVEGGLEVGASVVFHELRTSGLFVLVHVVDRR